MVRPIFRSWLKPFQDHGATSLTIRGTRGTDHLNFDALGIPVSSSSRTRSSTAR